MSVQGFTDRCLIKTTRSRPQVFNAWEHSGILWIHSRHHGRQSLKQFSPLIQSSEQSSRLIQSWPNYSNPLKRVTNGRAAFTKTGSRQAFTNIKTDKDLVIVGFLESTNPQRPGQSWLSQIYKFTESQRPLGQHWLSQRKRMPGQSVPGQQGAALVLFKQLFTLLQPSLPRSSYKQYCSASHLNSISQLLPTKLTFTHKRGPQKRSQNV